MMFFLKVRLNLHLDDIAYRFDVSKATVSRHFHTVLDILYVKTKPLIKWPDREVLRLTMPTSFRKFSRSVLLSLIVQKSLLRFVSQSTGVE